MFYVLDTDGNYIGPNQKEADLFQHFGLYYTSYPNGNSGWEYNSIPPKEFWDKLELISPGSIYGPAKYQLKSEIGQVFP